MKPERPAVYELTIAGPVGPVIRAALRPCLAAPSRAWTILRTAAIPYDAVSDLVIRLDRWGFDLEGIFAARPATPTGKEHTS